MISDQKPPPIGQSNTEVELGCVGISHDFAVAKSEAIGAGVTSIGPGLKGGLPDLMKPKEAVTLLADVYGSRKQAKDALIDLLGDGRLAVFADYFWIGPSADLEKSYSSREQRADAKRKTRVERKIFRRVPQLNADAKLWDWELGNFIVKQSARRHAVILKSRFVCDEINKYATEEKPGRSRDDRKRDEMWKALVAYGCENGREGFAKHKLVVQRVSEKLGSASGPHWAKDDIAKAQKTLSNLITEMRKNFGLARRR